jgi:hypothetical protein
MLDFLFTHLFWVRVTVVLLFVSTMANIYLIDMERKPMTRGQALVAFVLNAILIVGLTMTMAQ